MSDEVCACVSGRPADEKTGDTVEGRMKTKESESSWFRDLCLYGDEGLRLERRPMLEGSAAVAMATEFYCQQGLLQKVT